MTCLDHQLTPAIPLPDLWMKMLPMTGYPRPSRVLGKEESLVCRNGLPADHIEVPSMIWPERRGTTKARSSMCILDSLIAINSPRPALPRTLVSDTSLRETATSTTQHSYPKNHGTNNQHILAAATHKTKVQKWSKLTTRISDMPRGNC
jgi:hypothetical protein